MSYKDEQRATRESLKPKSLGLSTPGHPVQIGNQLILVNREAARRRTVDRKLCKPGFRGHIVNDYRYQREVAEGTNHERMLARRAA